MNKFLKDHSVSSHTFVTLYATWTAFLIADHTARTTVFAFLDKHPFYSLGCGFAAFAYARYSPAHSEIGILREADTVMTKIDQPAAQIAPKP